MGYVILIDSKSERVRGVLTALCSPAVNLLSSLCQNYRKEEMMEGQEVMGRGTREEKDQKGTASEEEG